MAVRPLSALAQPPPVLALAATMAVVSTVAPAYMLAAAIARIGAARAATIGAIGPILTLGLGALLLSEPISATQILGAVLVIGGVTLATRERTP